MATRITETLASHILSVYHAMEEDAVVIEENEQSLKAYTGSLADLIRHLAISMTYYSPIFRALYDGGYVALLDRGGRAKPSTVVLLREPQKDELLDLTFQGTSPILTLLNRIERIDQSLGGMNVIGVLADVDKRLTDIEKSIEGLEAMLYGTKSQ